MGKPKQFVMTKLSADKHCVMTHGVQNGDGAAVTTVSPAHWFEITQDGPALFMCHVERFDE